jgi:asparagine synthase (glutamine-hydrolysing)
MRIENSSRIVGAYLSGGLDSSLVVAIMARYYQKLNRKLHTFTVGIYSLDKDGNKIIESPDVLAAREVVEFYKDTIIHHEVLVTKEELLNSIEETVYQTNTWCQTSVRASTPMWWLTKYIKNNTDVCVVLSGEGSDECSFSYKYHFFAPSPEALQKNGIDLLKNLCFYDVLRGDHASSFGLEIRTPFLSVSFLQFYMSIDPKHKMSNDKIEKYHLRKAFISYLPTSILKRSKMAFSDAISSKKNSWHHIIQNHVKTLYKDVDFKTAIKKYPNNPPINLEALWYRDLFHKYYPKADNIIPRYWLPPKNWIKETLTDSSARELEKYIKKN